jgi:uncharacterized membrane protein YqjE
MPATSMLPEPRPQLPAVGVALSLFAESVAHRAELTVLELNEAREHALGSLLLAAGTAALVLCTGFALTLLAASLVWDLPHRSWWLAGLSALYLVGAGLTAFLLHRRLRIWRPLAEIQAQLHQDYQCLSHLIKSAAR